MSLTKKEMMAETPEGQRLRNAQMEAGLALSPSTYA